MINIDWQLVGARWSHRRYLTLHKEMCSFPWLTVSPSGPISEDSLCRAVEFQEQALRLKANKLY